MSAPSNSIQVFPVTGYQVGAVPNAPIIVMRLAFVTHPGQAPELADPGRYYAVSAEQAQELIALLSASVAQIQNTPEQPTPEEANTPA